MEGKIISAVVDPQVAEEIRQRAVEDDRSMSWVVRQAITEYLGRSRPASQQGAARVA